MHNGFDLMTLQAGGDVKSISRLRGTKFFSSGEDSDKIILTQKFSEINRSPVSKEL